MQSSWAAVEAVKAVQGRAGEPAPSREGLTSAAAWSHRSLARDGAGVDRRGKVRPRASGRALLAKS